MKQSPTARNIFIHVLKQPNFMTPTPLSYWMSDRAENTLIAELSEGTGMTRGTMYGVTFLDSNDHTERFYDISKSFDNMDDAIALIEEKLN
jgi:hypothetical protein